MTSSMENKTKIRLKTDRCCIIFRRMVGEKKHVVDFVIRRMKYITSTFCAKSTVTRPIFVKIEKFPCYEHKNEKSKFAWFGFEG